MTLQPDGTQPHKRRRLNIAASNQLQTSKLPSSSTTVPEQGGYYAAGVEIGVGESLTTTGALLPHCEDQAGQVPLECCYGMLCNIPTKRSQGPSPHSKTIPVEFRTLDQQLSSTADHGSITFDIQCPISKRILCELHNVAGISTQLYCHAKLQIRTDVRIYLNNRRRIKQSQSWFLNIIIFGLESFEEKVGQYLARYKMYLQDPLGCNRSVQYRNPHIFPSESDEIVMTDSFDSGAENLEIERLDTGPDLLAQLMEDSDLLLETEPPDAVKTALFRHQKQALTFMIRREEGWAFEDGSRDIWSRQVDSYGRSSYTNNISGCISPEAPPDFRGGVLADTMGLGKTLSMICLIAADQTCSPSSSPYTTHAPFGSVPSNAVKSTLLIVPPALIQTWEKQFTIHLKPEKLKRYVYHGSGCQGTSKSNVEFLQQYDVVITTYHTISAFWRKYNERPRNKKSLFSLTWHRVVLDEAHIIKNPQSQLAQACCALRSARRWAITGTPIQNNLVDFSSIVKFLRVHPYSDWQTFEEEIIKPWQNRYGTDAQGFLRLRALVRAITISRTKSAIQLPPRTDETHHLNFTAAEREKYDAVETRARELIQEAISSVNQGGKTINALQVLHNLRLVCNHGLLTQCTLEKMESRETQRLLGSKSFPETPDSLYDKILSGTISCVECGKELLEDVLEDPVTTGNQGQPQTTPCNQMICEHCKLQFSYDRTVLSPWDGFESSSSVENSTPVTPTGEIDVAHSIAHMSTKIKALGLDLHKHNATEKSVVFSYWTETLDQVQLMLSDKGIPYTRIDGKMSLCKRNEALGEFQCNDSIRVILVSITCGGAGLDLTTGSRAYLLEPHWNPMVEEQALCRVDRVGQKNKVTTIRYLMKGSFEEQIVELQKRKKMLAQVTFTGGPMLASEVNIGTLQHLKSVLG